MTSAHLEEPLKKSIHGLFQSASALLLVRNRAREAPKGLAQWATAS